MLSVARNERPRGPKVRAAPAAREIGDGDRDAEPDLREAVAAIAAHQVGDEDADDERRLEPLAEPDEEVCQHVATLRFRGS